jgi:hypothetical protein
MSKDKIPPRWRGSVNRDKTKGKLSEPGFNR